MLKIIHYVTVFSLAFFMCVVFGTISHELGHIAMAKLLGFDTVLHFGSMDFYRNGIEGDFICNDFENFMITFFGVFTTILIGIIGFIITLKNQAKFFWFGVFMSLFWSRQIINPLVNLFFNNRFSSGDELILSNLLNLPIATFTIVLGIIGVVICLYSIIKVPKKYFYFFIIGGLIGGVGGYYIWFNLIGPILLP